LNYRSIRDAVWACEVIGGSAKLVALRLVEHWPRIFPSLASLAKHTGLSERTVRDALRELEAKRVIATEHREGSSSTYSFVGVSIPALGTPAESAALPRQNLPDPPAKSAAPTPAESAPEADKGLSRQESGRVEAGTRELMPHEKAELRKALEPPTGARPVGLFRFRPGWKPKDTHRTYGRELGLTDKQMLERAEDCRDKLYEKAFPDEDAQFRRELRWLKKDLETEKFRNERKANPHGLDERPGTKRTAADHPQPSVFGRIASR
jgi:hypothetical protein